MTRLESNLSPDCKMFVWSSLSLSERVLEYRLEDTEAAWSYLLDIYIACKSKHPDLVSWAAILPPP